MTKIKTMTKEQLLISFDRLTRFKEPELRYVRVFTDIILSNAIEPKFKKYEIEQMSYAKLRDLAQEIINISLDEIFPDVNPDCEYIINKRIFKYEKTVFNTNENLAVLLDNKINYNKAIKLIDETNVFNLRWLKSLQNCDATNENRHANLYPVRKVLLVEGITEEILIPEFAKVLEKNFKENGIFILSAGGKNQVVKYFYRFAECLKIPIYVLMDSDAKENFEQIQPKLRSFDRIHLISKGEFEDILPNSLIEKTLNILTANISTCDTKELEKATSKVDYLEEFFRKRGAHEFKKSEFAQAIRENIRNQADISEEIKSIIYNLV